MRVHGAADVGAGLAKARDARPIRPGERIHVVGIAGAGASAAALLAAWAGADVDGCDPAGHSPYTAAVELAGIAVADSHDAAHVTGGRRPDRLAVSKALTAVAPDHTELVAARLAGVPVEPWQQVVADAAVGRRLVAVAGTHGKSTTAGWLVHVLAAAGADPGAFVGALLAPALTTQDVPATARRGRGAALVVEADEYAGNFDPYRPEVIVLTSAEWDHPDVFADRAAVLDAFEAWIRHAVVPGGPTRILVANAADPGVAELLGRLHDWPGRLVLTSVASEPASDLAERFTAQGGASSALAGHIGRLEPSGTMLVLEATDLDGWPSTPVSVHLATAGRHNAANALGVAAAAAVLGVGVEAALAALETFEGVGRRLERKGEARGVVVYDDYGHHPTAIRETIVAVRQREPGRRVWAVYEPLTFHRTAALLDEFAAALAMADAVAIADIWPGRDPDTTIASASGLAAAVSEIAPALQVGAPGSVEATAAWLAGEVRNGDVVLVMGGGRSYRIGELLLEELATP